MEKWVTVPEYAEIIGRNKESIYRSIRRGTIAAKRDKTGILLVKVDGIPDGTGGQCTDECTDSTEQNTEENTALPARTYDQAYIDLLNATIDGLKQQNDYLQRVHALAISALARLESPAQAKQERHADNDVASDSVPDSVPDGEPDHVPDSVPNVPSDVPDSVPDSVPPKQKPTRLQFLKAAITGRLPE